MNPYDRSVATASQRLDGRGRATPVLASLAVGVACTLLAAAHARAAGSPSTSRGHGPDLSALKTASAGELRAALRPSGGRARIVHLWASWCGPCIEELPGLVDKVRSFADRPLDVVFVSLDSRDQAPMALEIVRRLGGLPGRSLRIDEDGAAVLRSFDRKWTGAIPTTYVLGADGHLAGSAYGTTDLDVLAEVTDEVAPRPRLRLRRRSGPGGR